MYTRRLIPLYCSATLFLTGIAVAQPVAPDAVSAESPAASSEDMGPALAPPTRHAHPLTPQEQSLLQRYDKNGDGKLDAAELDAAHGAAQQAKMGRDVIARQIYDRLLTQFDTGHEGKLNSDQQKQAVDFLQTNRPRIYQAVARQFDRNADGKLDAGETAALFQYFANLPSDLNAASTPAGGARPPGALDAPASPSKPSQTPPAIPAVPTSSTPPSAPALPSAPGGRAPPAATPPGVAAPPAASTPPAASPAPAAAPSLDMSASLDAVPATPPAKAKGAKGGGGMVMRFYALLLEKFDHDHQGSLTAPEQAEAVAYLASNNPRLYARFVSRFDRNGDGRLDAQETAAMFTRLAKMSAKAQSSD